MPQTASHICGISLLPRCVDKTRDNGPLLVDTDVSQEKYADWLWCDQITYTTDVIGRVLVIVIFLPFRDKIMSWKEWKDRGHIWC